MFRSNIGIDEGLVLVERTPSVTNTAIHMFFVNTPLTVLWIDEKYVIQHIVLALPWRPFYAAKIPCKYVVELHPSLALHFATGDRIEFLDAQ